MVRWLVCATIAIGCNGASRVAGVECSSDADCKLGTVTGKCESTKFCSYPDSTCSGNRYSPGAGSGLGNTCVDGPAACGDKDQPCCDGSVCGTALACSQATTTCVCGGQGEPCCGGTTCDANLACGPDGACACGGIGQPCCGGTTCSSGLACGGGTCDGGVLEIAAGEGTSCALRTDHTVSCWGYDSKPFASDTVGMAAPVIASAQPFTIAGATDIQHVRAGGKHTCATKSDGTLWCWGHNESGQLGDGTRTSTTKAVQVAGLTGVTLFDLGKFHTCAVGNYMGMAGTWCWGHGSEGTHGTRAPGTPTIGHLGNHDWLDEPTPVRVDLAAATSAGQTVRSLSAGRHHTCVAMTDNTVWCWGDNSHGQLGTGNTTNTMAPVAAVLTGITIPAGAAIDEVAVTHGNSAGSSCLRLSTGATYCWGNGTNGELGDSTPLTPAPPARTAPTTAVTTTALGGAHLVQLSSGAAVTCGLDSAGNVWCWGEGYMGVLGNNDTTQANQPAPVQVQGLTGATQVSVGHRSACAVDGSNQLWCWGNNRKAQLTGLVPGGANFVATKVPL